MSRFFEALKEASRSNPNLSEDALNAHPEAATVDRSAPPPAPEAGMDAAQAMWDDLSRPVKAPEAEIPPAPPDPPRVERREAAPQATAVAFDPEALFQSFTPRRQAFSGGREAQVTLKATVPLIPNASGDLVLERYRRLRTKIQQLHAAKPINSLLVASPDQGDGKTITVLNMAWSFGMLPSFKVLVIDGDLRRKGVGETLGVVEAMGFGNLLDGSASVDEVVLKSDKLPFHFITAGTSKKSPAELLTRETLPSSLREMTSHFDLIVVDSPPANLVMDAQMLAGACDGVLLVGRALSTKAKALEKSLQDLSQFRIVGTVLNGVVGHERRGYYNNRYLGYPRANG